MIKRLAHRNANVQLYTLEVCPIAKPACPLADDVLSWRTLYHKIAALRYTGSCPPGASQMLFYDSQMTE